MTLNLTIITADRIYQSSDLRLVDPATGPRTFPSCKAVHVSGANFSGAITYTGIGEADGESTAHRMANWLDGGGDLSFDDILETLHRKSERWIDDLVRRNGRRYPHSIVVAGFVDDTPCLGIVSNFQRLDRPPRPTGPFETSTLRRPRQPTVVVTGQSQAVLRLERESLQAAAARHYEHPEEVLRQLQVVNSAAAARQPEFISDTCAAITIDAGGAGIVSLTAPSPIEFENITFGHRVPSLLDVARQLGIPEPRLVQGAFATNAPSAQTSARDCTGAVRMRDESYQLGIIAVDGDRAVATGIASDGRVVGHASVFSNPAPAQHWTATSDGQVEWLGVSAVNSGELTISRTGLIGGALSDGFGHLQPYIYDGGPQLLDRQTDADASVIAINPDGVCVGWASLDGNDRGQLGQRPAIWSPGAGIQVLETIPANWGNAIAVNARGQVLLWLHVGPTSLTAIVDGDAVVQLAGNGLPGMVPVGLVDDGTIIGFTNTERGTVAYSWHPDRGVVRLGTPEGWTPTAVSSNGWIAGNITIDGYQAASIRDPDGRVVALPHHWYHWARIRAITDGGVAVGATGGGGHEHAVVWTHE